MKYLSIIVMFVSLIMSSCMKSLYNESIYSQYLDDSPATERVYIEDYEAADKLLSIYKVENLLSSSVYSFKNTVNFTFYFSGKVSVKDIKNVQTYYSHMITQPTAHHIPPYFKALSYINNDSFTVLRIFVDKKLLIYQSFDFVENKSNYYENMDKIINRELYITNIIAFKKGIIEISDEVINIEILKPIKGSVVCVYIDVRSNFNSDKLDKLIDYVEEEIAPVLEEKSVNLYGMNIDFLGIQLKVKSNDGIFFDKVYYNGKTKKWLEADWNNYDFFNELD